MKQAVFKSTALKKPADKTFSLFSLTWPIFIEVSLYMFMGNADTLMLSQYSDNSVAAVGVSNQILNLIIVMFSFIATGTTVIISQFLGSRQKKEAMEVAYVSIGANFFISLAISAVVFFAAVPLLHMMGLSDALMPDAKVFLQVVGGLSFIQALIMTFSAILKSYGYTKDTMFVTIGMNILNIAGNFVVIFRFVRLSCSRRCRCGHVHIYRPRHRINRDDCDCQQTHPAEDVAEKSLSYA